MTRDVANTAIRDEMAERYTSLRYAPYTTTPRANEVRDDFKAGWKARDEEVKRLREALEKSGGEYELPGCDAQWIAQQALAEQAGLDSPSR